MASRKLPEIQHSGARTLRECQPRAASPVHTILLVTGKPDLHRGIVMKNTTWKKFAMAAGILLAGMTAAAPIYARGGGGGHGGGGHGGGGHGGGGGHFGG